MCCEILLWAYFTSGLLVLASQPNIPHADMKKDACAALISHMSSIGLCIGVRTFESTASSILSLTSIVRI